MKFKKIIMSVISMVTLFCILCTNVFADVNFGNDDGANFGEGNSNNFWGLKYPNGSKLYETEGLRITVYSAEDNTKVASTFDISGNNNINGVGDIYHFTNSTGELISKTEWLEYVGKTYNALDENSIYKFNLAVSKRYNRGSLVYSTKHVPELNSIDIISENNTQNLEKIKAILGDKSFLTDICNLIGGGITYKDFQKGKYKIAFEPVAYFCYGGYNFAMTATECGLWDKYLKNTLSAAQFNKIGLVNQLGNLTHSNLPRSAFLEKEDLGVGTYKAAGSDYYFSGTNAYNSNNCIIRCMGIGVVSAAVEEDHPEEGTSTTAEYHTDTYVYTSFFFQNSSGNDMVSPDATFSIYDIEGNLPRRYYYANSDTTVRTEANAYVRVYMDKTDYKEYENPCKYIGTYKNGSKIDIGEAGGNELSYIVKKESGGTIASGKLSFACPDGDSAMAWFKWKTPSTAQNVTITLSSNKRGVYIIDSDGNTCSTVTINARIDKVGEKTPPDPTATDRQPAEFKLQDEDKIIDSVAQYAPIDGGQTLSWYVWECTYHPSTYQDSISNSSGTVETYGVFYEYYNSKTAEEKERPTKVKSNYAVYLGSCTFTKKEYSVSLSADISVMPSVHVPTAEKNNALNTYTMKSGYGINIEINAHLSGNTGYCTGTQKANVLFPEFNYATYNRLLDKSGKTFVFKENRFSTYNDRVHFTPIWFPDDEKYIVYAEVFDVWCPAGQLSVRLTSDRIRISGNVYDDWHVAPDKP